MSRASVDLVVAGGVCTITLADEARRNALSQATVQALTEACDAADRDPAVRVVVLTNTGNTFCAGADLSERAGLPPGTPPPALPPTFFTRFARSPKPYVGRIAGHVVAGGMGLVAGLDLAVAVDDATFGFSEVRIGMIPAMIAVVCLPKLRDADARATFLRGHRFGGAEAARMGLVTASVPRAELDAAVQAIVDDLLLGSPNAIAATKRLLLEVPSLPTDEAIASTARLSAELFTSEDAQAGMAAYLAKRPAPWVPGAGGDQPT
jgi:methylglutaconyl-CoA hydratase